MKIKSHKQLVEEASLEIENLTPEDVKSKFIRSALSNTKPTPSPSNPLTNQLVIKKQDVLNGLTGKARDSAYKLWKEARKQERIAMRVIKGKQDRHFPALDKLSYDNYLMSINEIPDEV